MFLEMLEMIQFDGHIFHMGGEETPTRRTVNHITSGLGVKGQLLPPKMGR